MQTLETDKLDKEKQLAVLRAGSTKPVDVDERERVEGEWRRWKRTRDARKRAYLDLEAMLLDSGVITKEALWVRIPSSLHADDAALFRVAGKSTRSVAIKAAGWWLDFSC